MGEYMADARLEGEGMGSVLKNFGTVVGPLAATSAGLHLARHIIGGIAKEKAFDKKEAEDFAEVIGEIGAGADAVLGHLQEIGGLEVRRRQWPDRIRDDDQGRHRAARQVRYHGQ